MPSFYSTIDFTEIVLKSPLPLDSYLVENSWLSLRLIVNGVPCSETPAVNGDPETGRWVINSRLQLPQGSEQFKLAAIVNVGGLKVQLLAIDHSVSRVATHLKERPEGYCKITISEPGSLIPLTVICKVTMSSISKERRTLDASGQRKIGEGPNSEAKHSASSSREYLASSYLRASNLRDLDHKASALNQVGRAYYALYQETTQREDLEKAISIHEEATRFTSIFHPKIANHFELAGDALKAQFKQNGDPAILSKAISHYEKAVRATDDSDLNKASHLCDLGAGLHLRFERLGNLADIDRAIKNYQKAVEITPDDHPNKNNRLGWLGTSLTSRFDRLGNLIDLHSAIESHQNAVKSIPDGHPDRAGRLRNLGNCLARRFKRLGSLTDLDSAIEFHREVVELTPDDHPEKPSRFSNVGTALTSRFERLGNIIDLDSAIVFHQNAVETTPDDHLDKQVLLSNLGNSLTSRFERLGNLLDLHTAIQVHQEAVKITPDGHPNKPNLLNNLGVSLTRRFEQLGNINDLNSAITVNQQAIKITPDGHFSKPNLLGNLGNSLIRLFERLGGITELDSAIEIHQRAVDITPDDHPDKPNLLNSLGVSLTSRFERLGNLHDLDSAIPVHQKAAEIAPDGYPEKSSLLSNLGNSLSRRFERLGCITDLQSAIEIHQMVIKITPDDHPNKPNLLNNLGVSLTSRFERLADLIDLDSAISVHEAAVQMTPEDHPNQPHFLDNLGFSLLRRFERLGSPADLDSAIAVHQKAVSVTPDGHPDRSSLLGNLGNSLCSRFKRFGSVTDLNNAVQAHENAVKMAPDNHPNYSNLLGKLGNSLLCRFERLCNISDLEDALQSYSQASQSPVGSPMVRLESTRWWASALDQHSRSPLPAFRCAIHLLPRIAWLGLTETSQHDLIADIGDVVRDAVAAAVKFEEYETAVEWAEQGRSIVWQNLLNLRTPIDDLRIVNPALANRLQDISRQLESPIYQGIGYPAVPIENIALKRSKLATEWDIVVEEIRRIPEFEGFLDAKSFSQLAPAASEGPVIILNVNKSRSDALVLVPDNSSNSRISIVHIPLISPMYALGKILLASMNRLLSSAGVGPRGSYRIESVQHSMSGNTLSYEAFDTLFEDLMGGLSPPRIPFLSRKSERYQSLEDVEFNFSEVLGLLWLGVVKPVLDGLAFSAESEGPCGRVWWCATGPLSFLPLHAAGIYGTGEKGNVISDYVISSYIPTLTSILHVSQPILKADFQILTVAVAQSLLPNSTPIYGTEDETRLVRTLAMANGIQCVNLRKEDATMERVIQEMMESDWIHISCHGQQNNKDPMESGFLLYDRILALSDIVKLSLPKADFAFLSACQTATGDEKIAEESVHLAAGMLLSGCQGVIATMWSISDNDAPKVARDVYREILQDGRPNRKGAAYALDEAVKGLRESGADFLSWVPFIHIRR